MGRLDADRFLEDLTGRFARPYTNLLDEMLIAAATGNAVAMRSIRQRLNELMRETMGVAEIFGASLVLQDAAKIATKENFSTGHDRPRMAIFADQPTQTIIPRVTFSEAVQDLVDRTPVTIRSSAERAAQNIANIYSEGTNIAFVRSAEQAVTERVQKLIGELLREGSNEVDAGTRIVKSVKTVRNRTAAWSKGYARMVFRTNMNTAVTAGRFRTMQDPEMKKVMPAFEFNSVGDVDTRHNHDAADGVIMSVDDQRWNQIAPPLGYNCRCEVRAVGAPELGRMGRLDTEGNLRRQTIPGAAGPDEGFRHGGRPDIFLRGQVR